MAELNILQQGDVKKFIITSRNPILDMEACDFYVEQIYGTRNKKVVVKKSEMLYGTDGEFVMIVDTTPMVGKVTARFVWQAIDTDIDPDNRRQEVDEQVICFVATVPNPTLFCCPKTGGEGHDVNYEWTDEPDIAAKYLRLVCTEIVTPESGGEPYTIYRPLVTRNDEYIYVLREAIDDLENLLNNNN